MDAVLASTIDILEDVVKLPDWQSELAFTEPRHQEPITGIQSTDGSWRLKERVKTVSVALVLCLNVGVDPPDIVKIEPCAHYECWYDPLSDEPQKAIEHISLQLEKQYEQWHSRARYKKCLDPTVEEVKRLCTSLRRYSKEDRVLFHYNGHGVPRPTQNGEIWVFNERYTQYIPLAIYDLQQWMGAPSIYVFDCSCAGSIVNSYLEFAKQHKRDYEMELTQYNAYQQTQRQIIIRGSDQEHQSPSNLKHHQQQEEHNQNKSTTNHQNNNNLPNQTGIKTPTTRASATNVQQATNTNLQSNINTNSTNGTNNDNTNAQQPPPIRAPPIKPPDYENCFQLAACEAHQILPMQPDLPADLFTSCLTTPIKMALRWFIQKNDMRLIPKVSLAEVDLVPGLLSDRRTMLGELNWIFTAITDTIAWDVLPKDLFQRLYRQDLLVASLFRNFLLADRIMRTYDCTPVSHPRLPKTYHHPMWRAWDMVVDLCLSQLKDVNDFKKPFKTSSFFAEQLTAFEVWLDLDHSSNQQPDHQLLPIILQVLLSPVHRLRALDLLSRFLNLGPGAVHSALSVGIFPYVLKLLQSNAREVRPFLLSIWAKILAIDRRCQVDLVRDHYHRYFLTILSDGTYDAHYRTMAAFVMTCIVRDYPLGQEVAYQANLIAYCLEQLDDPDPMLRKWLAICLGTSWDNYEDARWCGVRSCAHEKLYTILDDPDPEVRAAAIYALGTFINASTERTDHANTIDHSIGMKIVSTSLYDSSVLVRHELVVALQYLILAFESQFSKLASAANPLVFGSGSKIVSNVYHVIWKAMCTLASDPHPKISSAAQVIIDEIRSRFFSGMSSESLRESKSNSSISESSSPNTAATFSISESPPSTTTTAAPYNSSHRGGINRAGSSNNTESTATNAASTVFTALTSAFNSSSPSKLAATAAAAAAATAGDNRNQNHNQNHLSPTQPPPMPNNKHSSATLNESINIYSNQQQHPSSPVGSNLDRSTKSANVTINKASHHRRYNNNSNNHAPIDDDNRSNLSSSQRQLISTDFVDWCTKYFIDPQNNYTSSAAASRARNGGLGRGGSSQSSKEEQQREWRMLRVLSYKNVCLRELMVVDPIRFNENVSSYKVSHVPQLITVHPYDPIMVIAGRDEFSIMHLDGSHVDNYNLNNRHRDGYPNHHHHHHHTGGLSSSISSASIHGHGHSNSAMHLLGGNSINNNSHHHQNHLNNSSHHNNHHNGSNQYNQQDGLFNDLIGTQSNCHSSSSQITSLQLINPQYNTLICTGSSEGSVRIWKAYNSIESDYTFNPQLISAFQLMPELQPHRQGLGMILLWDQNQSRFYATSDQNDVRMIKVWDAVAETKVQDIPTCAEFGVSCLSSDGEHSIAAGFLDGSIRIYDTRLKKTDCRTFTFRKHSEKILTLHMFKPGEKHINLVSGDSCGEVRFWDKRAPTSVKRVDVGQKMSVMSVHPNADVFAW